MNHLSLFSGIGGLDLAAEWAGFTTVAFVERDPYCQRVLAQRWPGVPCFADVRGVTLETVLDADRSRREGGGLPIQRACEGSEGGDADADGAGEGIRIVSGGFPCQPHSVAGKRQASADDRDLWPEVARVLREIRPRWFVGENVRGLLHSESGRFFGSILGDLADMGYRVGWGVWGASDVGALHQRERVFIVARRMADTNDEGPQGREREGVPERASERAAGPRGASVADAARELQHGAGIGAEQDGWRELADGSGWRTEPDVGRVAYGIPSRVDRLRALGNAVVPQQAYPLFAEIARLEGVGA